jgi:hypothetical protein
MNPSAAEATFNPLISYSLCCLRTQMTHHVTYAYR